MSDQSQAAPDTSAQNPPAAAAPATSAAPQPAAANQPAEQPIMSTEALNERLERERRKLLKDLGVENVDDVKTALAELKAKREAAKTEGEKTAEKLAELAREKARADSLHETVAKRAAAEMKSLSDEQRAAVVEIAGDDVAAQLRAITALTPTWAAKPAAAQAQTQTAAPASTPATTAPPRSAPSDSTQTQSSPKETYLRLKKTNPVMAAEFLTQHAREIYPSS